MQHFFSMGQCNIRQPSPEHYKQNQIIFQVNLIKELCLFSYITLGQPLQLFIADAAGEIYMIHTQTSIQNMNGLCFVVFWKGKYPTRIDCTTKGFISIGSTSSNLENIGQGNRRELLATCSYLFHVETTSLPPSTYIKVVCPAWQQAIYTVTMALTVGLSQQPQSFKTPHIMQFLKGFKKKA